MLLRILLDEFKIGQMFNAEQNESYGVSTDNPIHYTLTTKGFLSNGCSNPLTINGGYGDDTFDVLRNKCVLDLNGDSGNDDGDDADDNDDDGDDGNDDKDDDNIDSGANCKQQ